MCWGNIRAEKVFLCCFPGPLQRLLSPVLRFSAAPWLPLLPIPRSLQGMPGLQSYQIENHLCPTMTDGIGSESPSQTRSVRPLSPWYQIQAKIPHTHKENYSPILLMNIDAKFSTKYQQTESNNTLKESYTMIKWDLCQRYTDFSVSSNQSVWYSTLTNWRIKILWSFQQMQKKHLTKFNTGLW